MERRAFAFGSCCVTSDDVAWKLGRIMLKYRPIAPKPLAAAAAQGAAVDPTTASGRVKRSGRRGRKSRKVEAAAAAAAARVTLPLMPETPERKEGAKVVGSPTWERKEGSGNHRSTGTLVTVERVTEGLCGSSAGDEGLMRWLDADDCPAFFSDGEDRVTRTNAAFLRMVVGGGGGLETSSSTSSPSSSYNSSTAAAEEEVRVWLETQGLIPGGTWRVFTCMASVRYTCRRRGKVMLAAPCDVWRLEDGSLGWRLDVKAALSLSIGT